MQNQQNIIETALAAAQKPFVFEQNGQFITATPSEDGAWLLEHEAHLQTTPTRPRSTINLHDTKSFIAYVKNHTQQGTQVAINADFANGGINVVAILDGHHQQQAGWSEWRAKFAPSLTTDANAFMRFNKKPLSQSDFGSFLTNHAHNIVAINPDDATIKYPTAAEVLDFSLNLEILKTFKFKRGYREQDGTTQFEFKEENNAGTEKRLQAFEKFGISFQPYLNGPAYFVEVALKFRIDNNTGSCVLWYELKNIENVFENAAKDIANTIEAALGESIPVYYGSF